MVIEYLAYTREEDTGTGAIITLGLKEFRIVQTQQVSVALPKIPKAPPVKKGTQNPADGSPAQQQSVLTTLAKGGQPVVNKILAAVGLP
jgi:hypothetical protein